MKTTALLYVPIFLLGSALAPAWAAEQQQQKKNQPQQARKQDSRQPTLDTNKGESITSKKGDAPKTDDGVSGGSVSGGGTAVRTVPGGSATTSGNYKAPQQQATPATPAGALYDPKGARPSNAAPGSEGKLVTPGDFSRDKQIKDLTDTKSGLTEQAPKGNAITDREKADPLGTISTTGPGRGEGRNTVDKTGQQSVTGNMDKDKKTVTLTGNRGEVEFKLSKDGTKLERETIKVHDKDATVTLTKDYETKTTSTTVEFVSGQFKGQSMTQVNGGEWKQTKSKTPNPETDTGDGHMPKGLTGMERPQKSPGEIEAERKRQTSLPIDDQRRELERMRMDADVALKSASAQRTAGKIDPGPSDGTTGGGSAPAGAAKPVTPGVASGRPQNPTKGGVPPPCPGDNPTC